MVLCLASAVSLSHKHWSVCSWICKGTPSAELQGSLSMELPPLWDSVLKTLAALVFLGSQLHVFNSSVGLYLSFPSLCCSLETLSPGRKLGQSQGSSSLFSISQGSLSFVFWYRVPWDHCFMYFDWFLWLFQAEGGQFGPCQSILAGSRSFQPVFLLLVSSPVQIIVYKHTDCQSFLHGNMCSALWLCLCDPSWSSQTACFLNLTSLWQLKSEAHVFPGLDPRQACQFRGCVHPGAPEFSMPVQHLWLLIPQRKAHTCSLASGCPCPDAVCVLALSGMHVCLVLMQPRDFWVRQAMGWPPGREVLRRSRTQGRRCLALTRREDSVILAVSSPVGQHRDHFLRKSQLPDNSSENSSLYLWISLHDFLGAQHNQGPRAQHRENQGPLHLAWEKTGAWWPAPSPSSAWDAARPGKWLHVVKWLFAWRGWGIRWHQRRGIHSAGEGGGS